MDKKAVVTGGSNGIGLGIVRCLAEDGYDIAFNYNRHREGAEAVRAELAERFGAGCHIFKADFTVEGEGVSFFKKAADAVGGVGLLVNNAGITRFESIFDLTEETMDMVLAVDFRYMI
jgi:NAD(P)-dependent dehydrogenase (short-subunit alcohol dehydrogenase family)